MEDDLVNEIFSKSFVWENSWPEIFKKPLDGYYWKYATIGISEEAPMIRHIRVLKLEG